MKTIAKRLRSAELWLIMVAAVYILILAVGFSMLRILNDAIIPSIAIAGICCSCVLLPVVILLYYAFKKMPLTARYCVAIFFVVLVGLLWSLVVCTIVPADDQLVLMVAANDMTGHGTFSDVIGRQTRLYMEHYPYQSGYCLFLYVLCRIFGAYPFVAARVVNVVIMAIVVVILAKLAKELSHDERHETWTLLLCPLFIPIAMASFKAYGNVLTLPFVCGSVYFAIRLIRHKSIKLTIYLLLCAFLAVCIKPNSVIIIIAVIITYALHAALHRRLFPAMVAILLIGASFLGDVIPPAIYGAMTGFDMTSQRLEPVTWLAMGISYSDGLYGFYDGRDIPRNPRARDAIQTRDENIVKKRVAEFKSSPHAAARFYFMKTMQTWSDPTFGILSNDYGQIGLWRLSSTVANTRRYFSHLIYSSNGIKKGIPQYDKAQLYYYGHFAMATQVYCDGMQIVITLLMVLGLLRTRKRIRDGLSDVEDLVPGLAFLGGFLFHLLWETQPEYAFTYFILLMPYAAIGADTLILHIHGTGHHIHQESPKAAGAGDSGILLDAAGQGGDGQGDVGMGETLQGGRDQRHAGEQGGGTDGTAATAE